MILAVLLSLTAAIIEVESGGDNNAVGDGGKALGCLQIHKAYFKDAQEFDKSLEKYTYQDVRRRDVAIKVFNAYISRYCTEKRLGRKPTDEDRARCHNSGPNWFKKMSCTDGYWAKVKKAMK